MKCQVIKQFIRRGVSHHPGSIINVPESMLLKMAGFVEVVATADSYVPASIPTPTRTCFCCKGDDFWQSAVQENHSVCRKCHPPAPGAEKGATI